VDSGEGKKNLDGMKGRRREGEASDGADDGWEERSKFLMDGGGEEKCPWRMEHSYGMMDGWREWRWRRSPWSGGSYGVAGMEWKGEDSWDGKRCPLAEPETGKGRMRRSVWSGVWIEVDGEGGREGRSGVEWMERVEWMGGGRWSRGGEGGRKWSGRKWKDNTSPLI